MNLFLAQKTTPLKSKLAKFFAIFLVCFFIIGTGGRSLIAAEIPYSEYTPEQKAYAAGVWASVPTPAPGQLVAGVELRQTLGGWGPNITATTEGYVETFKDPKDNAVYKVYTLSDVGMLSSQAVTRYTFSIDPKTGGQTFVPNFQKFPVAATDLELDPSSLPKDGPVGYNYAGGVYTYTDGNGNKVELSPDHIRDQLDKIRLENGDPAQRQAISNSIIKAVAGTTKTASTLASNQAATGNANNTSRPANDMYCGTTNFPCIAARLIYITTIKPASWLLAASGWLLETVFLKTIVNLSTTLKGGNGTGAGASTSFYAIIRLVWGIFRDLINMSFIFLLLYASIKTIILADTAGLKKTIRDIVIVALLMNFSLFFVELTIDVSNNFAVTIYNTINQGASKDNNLAVAFMDTLNLKTLMGTAMTKGKGGDFTTMITICIFGSVFILVLAVVFFIIAILFIVRFIEFMILMMMSPIGMGAFAIPKLNMAFSDGGFWSNLLNQCFFAPIMFIFLWISVKMLTALTSLTGPKTDIAALMTDDKVAGGVVGSGGVGGLGAYILGFIVVIFILIKGITFAKSMSAKGAGALQSGFLKYSGANWVQNKMQNAPMNIARGTGAFAGRQTIGRAATRIATSGTMRNMQSTAMGRFLKDKTTEVGKAGFGGKKGFSEREADSVKRKEAAHRDLLASTLSERSNLANKEDTAAKAKAELDAVKNAGEAIASVEEHKASSAQINKELADAKQAKFDATSPEDIKLADDKIKIAEGKMKETNKVLIDSFKKAGVEMTDTSTESVAKAVAEAKDKQEKIASANGIDLKGDPGKLGVLLTKLNDKESKANEKLREIAEHLKTTATDRSLKYQMSLRQGRLAKIGLQSKSSTTVALNIRKEALKNPTELADDKLAKMIKDAMKSNEPKK